MNTISTYFKRLLLKLTGITGIASLFSSCISSPKNKPELNDAENLDKEETVEFSDSIATVMYGMPPNIKGKVIAKDSNGNTKPVKGIEVSIDGEDCILTNENGEYTIFTSNGHKKITFTDIDGKENGAFQKKSIDYDFSRMQDFIETELDEE